MSKQFKTSDQTHADGPLVGEPMRETKRAARIPKRAGEVYQFPHIAVARAQATGKSPPEWAKKLIGQQGEPLPGEAVPQTGSTAESGGRLEAVSASRQIPNAEEVWSSLIASGEVIAPPFEPWHLVCTALESAVLPPSIDAMATNIGGFGTELVPMFETEDAVGGQPLDVPPEAIEERGRLKLFVHACNPKLGLTGLMYQTDHDIETVGYGAVEVLRDRLGNPAALEHVPAYTLRLGRLSPPIMIERPVRHPEGGQIVSLPRFERFRTFVQIRNGCSPVHFREFGDPRFINRNTGEYRETSWGMDPNGGGILDGSEIRYFCQYACWTPYGVPRWLGAAPQVKAARSTGELVVDWYENAPIGAKIALVAGGVWSKESITRSIDMIDDMARGIENAWTLITLEAEATNADPIDAGKESRPAVVIDDYVVQIPPDLYKGPDSLWSMSRKQVKATFRLPPLYYGESDDYSRATAASATAVSEEQVFVPIRTRRWLPFLNMELLPMLGINFWTLALKGANTTGDSDMPFAELTAGGGASPNALIRAWNGLQGTDREPIAEPWGNRPMALTLELLKMGLDPNKPLSELAADMEAKAAEAAAAAKEQLDALGKASKPPGKDDPPPTPEEIFAIDDEAKKRNERLAESMEVVMRAKVLREFLVAKIADPDWNA